jgi:predicted metal-dependent peptidase
MDFSEINFYLLKNNPFYYGMLTQAKIKLDPKSKYLAFVQIKNKIEITLNPEKLSTLSVPEQAGIVIHEFQHIFSGHIKQALQKRPEAISNSFGLVHDPMKANVAMDCEINSRIPELRNSSNLGPTSKGEFRGVYAEDFKLPEGDSWFSYFKQLIDQTKNLTKEQVEKMMKEGNGDGEGKDHDYFMESDENAEYADHIVEIAAKNAKEAVKGHLHGNVPHEVEEFLDEVERSKSLPWNLILRQFFQALVSVKQSSSWKKRSRRFKGKLPGVKKEPRIKVLVGMDESGSVSNDERAKLVNELIAIHDTGIAEIWIGQFDTELHSYFKFDGEIPPRRSHGGTDFEPIHRKAIEERFKGLIMLTDGECSYPDAKEVTYKALWVMTTDQKAPYGRSIRLK